jgi:hypothetical protein
VSRLVGSEMCIRDRHQVGAGKPGAIARAMREKWLA